MWRRKLALLLSFPQEGLSRASCEWGPQTKGGWGANPHLSCLVWLTMDRTFSSPSIFGLPNSSSFTCWKGNGR